MSEQTIRAATMIGSGAGSGADTRARAVPAALAALMLGVFILLGVGFAHPNTIHNAAHDGRHSFAFPCH